MDFENDYEPGYYDELDRDWDEPYEPDCVTGCDPTEYEDEWDGQPDEAQEWYDFDPDC